MKQNNVHFIEISGGSKSQVEIKAEDLSKYKVPFYGGFPLIIS